MDGLIAALHPRDDDGFRQSSRDSIDFHNPNSGSEYSDIKLEWGIPKAMLPGVSQCELYHYEIDINSAFPWEESGEYDEYYEEGNVYACRWDLPGGARSEFISLGNNIAECIHTEEGGEGPTVIDDRSADDGERFSAEWSIIYSGWSGRTDLELLAYKVANQGMSLILHFHTGIARAAFGDISRGFSRSERRTRQYLRRFERGLNDGDTIHQYFGYYEDHQEFLQNWRNFLNTVNDGVQQF